MNAAYHILKDPEKKAEYDSAYKPRSSFHRSASPFSDFSTDDPWGGFAREGFNDRAGAKKRDVCKAILNKEVGGLNAEDMRSLHYNFADSALDISFKKQIIERVAKEARMQPALASGVLPEFAIEGIRRGAGSELFEAILDSAPNAFSRRDVTAIEGHLNSSNTDASARKEFYRLATKLVAANKDLAPDMTRLAISSVKRGAGSELFEAILDSAPNAFSGWHIANIQEHLDSPHTDADVRKEFYRLATKLVAANKDLAPDMTQLAIDSVKRGAGSELFEVILDSAPKAFSHRDISTINRHLNSPDTDAGVRKEFYRLAPMLLAANKDLAPDMTELAIDNVKRGAGSELFEAILDSAPKAFSHRDISTINKHLDSSHTDAGVREDLLSLAPMLLAANKDLAPDMTQLAIDNVKRGAGSDIFEAILDYAPSWLRQIPLLHHI